MSDFYVGIKEIPEGTVVHFQPFPKDLITDFRKIASISVIGSGSVKLEVYVDETEIKSVKEVKVYKKDPDTEVKDWKKAKKQSNIKEDKKIGKWKGYIELELEEGDPPVAVG
jgi:hypothetical protein